jgi:hypothetical protein
MFSGFHERIEKEIIGLAPEGMRVEVVAAPERKYVAWLLWKHSHKWSSLEGNMMMMDLELFIGSAGKDFFLIWMNCGKGKNVMRVIVYGIT